MKISLFPKCENNRCFAYCFGQCKILTDSNFGGKPCPFYKSKERAAKDEAYAAKRLEKLGNAQVLKLRVYSEYIIE